MFKTASIALGVVVLAMAAPVGAVGKLVKTEGVPALRCDRYRCDVVPADRWNPATLPGITAPLNPVVIGPPRGQQFMWTTATCPTSFNGFGPAAPMEYMEALDVAVPLGSTHAALDARFQITLAGGPTGSASAGAMIRIRRSGSPTWEIAASNYQLTALAEAPPRYVYGQGGLMALENLSQLAGGTGVPSAIDLQVVLFNVEAGGFVSAVADGCRGSLSLTF